jgi:hypothetical protein
MKMKIEAERPETEPLHNFGYIKIMQLLSALALQDWYNTVESTNLFIFSKEVSL